MTYVPRVVTRQRRRALQPVALTSVVALAALILTAGVAVLPYARFAYRAPVLHVVLGCVNPPRLAAPTAGCRARGLPPAHARVVTTAADLHLSLIHI